MFSLYDLGASLSLSPVPGDALPEVEFPPDVAELLLDGVAPEAVAPEDAASGAAALETVAPGLAVLVPVAPPPVCAEVAVGRAALVLLALTLTVAG